MNDKVLSHTAYTAIFFSLDDIIIYMSKKCIANCYWKLLFCYHNIFKNSIININLGKI